MLQSLAVIIIILIIISGHEDTISVIALGGEAQCHVQPFPDYLSRFILNLLDSNNLFLFER